MKIIVIGATGTIGSAVAKAYVDSVEGSMNGTVIDARAFA